MKRKTKFFRESNELRYSIFPELAFFQSEDEMYYCDVREIAKNHNVCSSESILEFETKFKNLIETASVTYEIPQEDLIVVCNKTGNVLIEETLVLIYISFVDPSFCLYINEKVTELLTKGITISDNYLLVTIKDRFDKSDILTIYNESI